MKKFILNIFLVLVTVTSFGQTIKGRLLSVDNKPIAGATVKIHDSKLATFTDKDGYFRLNVASKKKYFRLHITFIGMQPIDTTVQPEWQHIILHMKPSTYQIEHVEALGKNYTQNTNFIINHRILDIVSTLTDNAVETLIMTSMGVQTSNELSSQYSVRGGSYDENLVYIDGIEVFRPILIHSGQQEGLSIINPDFVENIKFSAGGFEAHYGDKMSSVLDVTYKTPKQKKTKLSLGLTGISLFHQNLFNNGNTSAIIGARIKQNSYLLNALPTKGNYKPFFSDLQIVLDHKFSNNLKIRIFNYISVNRYNFYPDSMTLALGTLAQNFRLPISYEGAEKDRYNFLLTGLKISYRLSPHTLLQWNNSVYLSDEAERYTIGAAYRLDMVEREMDQDKDSSINIGVGYYLTYSRNYLRTNIFQSNLKISTQLNKHTLTAGLSYRQDRIQDELTRWKYIDSAGYSFSPEASSSGAVAVYTYVNASNHYATQRLTAFTEDFCSFYLGRTNMQINMGLRYTYYALNNSSILSPRISLYIRPDWLNIWTFRFSYGHYYQLPLYNELRDFHGHISHKISIQKSIHYVAGAYRNFRMWERPFKFSSEIYYKDLCKIIPFEYDNLRIQYYANETAHGYAAGIDMRLYGEFVPDVDSWISLSLMRTREDIANDSYWQYYDNRGDITYYKEEAADSVLVEPGLLPRATDQLLTIGLFFQDYMPQMKNMRMNMSLFFGTGRPYGPPTEGRYKATLRMPAYLRADIGFLYIHQPKDKKYKAIFELDLFNALGVMNVASYSWLTILTNTTLIGYNPLGNNNMFQIAAPNYLTGRLVNLKVKFIF